MTKQTYLVKCKACKKASRLHIVNDTQVIYQDHVPIISARLRGDMQWGFECICGNDSRLAREELPQIDTLIKGGSREAMARIAASLRRADKSKFVMEPA